MLAAVAAATGVALPVLLVGELAVQIRHGLHFGAGRLGIAVALYYAAAAAASVPSGRLAEVLGGARVMRGSALLAACSLVAIAGGAHSWLALALALVPAGIASSAAQPAANQFLFRTVAPTRQGTAFGIKQSAIPLATLLGGLAVPGIALTIGWRWAFAGAAGIALVASLLAPRRSRSADEGTAGRPGAGPADPASRGALVLLAVAFALGLFAASSLATFLVGSGVAAGLGEGTAGLVAALASGIGLAARLAVGVQADRRGARHFPVVAVMLAVGAGGYVLLALGASLHAPWVFVPGAALAFGAGWGWNGLFNFAVVRSHPSSPASATALTQAGGRLGSVFGPLVFGFLVARASYEVAWLSSAATALLAASGMLLGRKLLVAARSASPQERPAPLAS